MRRFILIFILMSLSIGCGSGQVTANRTDDGAVDAKAGDTADTKDAARDAGDADSADARPNDAGTDDASNSRPDAADTGGPNISDTDASDARADASDTQAQGDVQESPAPFVVWMAVDGSDSRDGQSPDEAVLTMSRVQQILEANSPEIDVEVRIAAGRYRGQKVRWSFSIPGHSVTFTRHEGEESRPIFDGCLGEDDCPGGTWFTLVRSDGVETRIAFNYLRIENYQTAISLNGQRDDEAHSNGSNRIYGCYFYRIGNVFDSSVDPSTAAVRLVNSDDNEIINNHFVDIINTRSAGILHAIYVAHMSDRNQILRNRFQNNAGGPIRLRDYSNDNIINENTFKKIGIIAAYSEWYCDHDARDDCTKPTAECPSWGNQFRDNHLNGTYACETLGVFKYYQDDATTGCSPPSPGAHRLRTSGNTQATVPCE